MSASISAVMKYVKNVFEEKKMKENEEKISEIPIMTMNIFYISMTVNTLSEKVLYYIRNQRRLFSILQKKMSKKWPQSEETACNTTEIYRHKLKASAAQYEDTQKPRRDKK